MPDTLFFHLFKEGPGQLRLKGRGLYSLEATKETISHTQPLQEYFSKFSGNVHWLITNDSYYHI